MNREEINQELLESLKQLLHLHSCEEEGLQSGQPTTSDWYHATNNARISVERAEEALKQPKPQSQSADKYLEAKYVRDNPKGYHKSDVSHARVFCEGFEYANQKALTVTDESRTCVHNFSKRLDRIFEMGDPTKVLIIDAFIKNANQSQSEVSDEAIDEWLEKEDYSFVGIFIKKSEMIEHFIKEEDAIELIKKGIKEFKPQSITNSVSDEGKGGEWVSVNRLPDYFSFNCIIRFRQFGLQGHNVSTGIWNHTIEKFTIDKKEFKAFDAEYFIPINDEIEGIKPLPTPPINKEQ